LHALSPIVAHAEEEEEDEEYHSLQRPETLFFAFLALKPEHWESNFQNIPFFP